LIFSHTKGLSWGLSTEQGRTEGRKNRGEGRTERKERKEETEEEEENRGESSPWHL
jgi:hypothetical protein